MFSIKQTCKVIHVNNRIELHEDDIGKLVSLIQQKNGIELTPPSPERAADLTIKKAKKKASETADAE